MNPRFQALALCQSNFKRKRKHSCFLRTVDLKLGVYSKLVCTGLRTN